MSLEAAPRPKPERPKPDWREYMFQVDHLATTNQWNELEELLLEPHPLLPGEREAFLSLSEELGRPPRVELDQTGMHVVPIESDT